MSCVFCDRDQTFFPKTITVCMCVLYFLDFFVDEEKLLWLNIEYPSSLIIFDIEFSDFA